MGYFWLLLATCGLSEDIMSFPEEGRTLLVDSSKVMSVSFDGTWSGTFGGYMEVPTESIHGWTYGSKEPEGEE